MRTAQGIPGLWGWRQRGFSHRRRPTLILSHEQSLRILRSPFMWFWAVVALVAAVALPFLTDSFVLRLVNLSFIAVIGALALNVLMGMAGIISLGHAAFLAIGGFSAALLGRHLGVPFFLAVAGSVVVGGVVGGLVGLPALRLKALYVAITTFALHFAVVLGVTWIQAAVASYSGIPMPLASLGVVNLTSEAAWYFFLLGCALLAMLAVANLRRSRMGRALVALHDHEVAAEALGIPLTRIKLSAFVYTSAMTAFAGAVAGYYAGVVSADTYTLHLAVTFIAMIIIGGLGHVSGAVLGGLFVVWLPYVVDHVTRLTGLEVGRGRISGLQMATFAAVLVLFILFEPGGLVRIWTRIRDWFTLWPFRVLPLEQRER